MTAQTIQIQLPAEIYHRLQRVADATQQPLEAVVFQTIQGNLPPSLDDLSPDLQLVVADLPALSDAALWEIARAPLPPRPWRRHQHLLAQGQAGHLSAADAGELAALRTTTDRYVTRRSYALALLKWRGHTLPAEL
jgi:hypothetical protein